MGKHQWLKNGHLLITESKNGRAFEVDKNGNIVWEFVNLVDEGRIGLVQDVQRLPSYVSDIFENLNCANSSSD